MSNVVVSVIESVTSVAVSEQDVAVTVTESPVTIVTGTSGPQGATGTNGTNGLNGATGPTGATGAQGPSGVVAVDGTYITNSGTSTSANLAFVPSALTITQSQVTGLVSELAGKAALTASQTFTGLQTFVPASTNAISVVVSGGSAQAVSLQEWRNSGGTVMANISAGGSLITQSGRLIAGGAAGSGRLDVQSSSATQIGATIRGAASQSANLQQWQNSAGTSLASVTAAGEIYSSNAVRSTALYTGGYLFIATEENSGGKLRMTRASAQASSPGANVGAIYFRDGTNAGTLKLVVRAGTAGAETTILDNIPQ